MDAYLGEIRIFAGNYEPRNWAFCEGQLLQIPRNPELFSILGTIYGGDGKTTFALPNLTGRAPMHAGAGPGLTPRSLGEMGGSSTETLLEAEIPRHQHSVNAVTSGGISVLPDESVVWSATTGRPGPAAYVNGTTNSTMSMMSLDSAGGSQPHNNRQPYLGIRFIICLNGIFPPRP